MQNGGVLRAQNRTVFSRSGGVVGVIEVVLDMFSPNTLQQTSELSA
jgi:hypothetical protein